MEELSSLDRRPEIQFPLPHASDAENRLLELFDRQFGALVVHDADSSSLGHRMITVANRRDIVLAQYEGATSMDPKIACPANIDRGTELVMIISIPSPLGYKQMYCKDGSVITIDCRTTVAGHPTVSWRLGVLLFLTTLSQTVDLVKVNTSLSADLIRDAQRPFIPLPFLPRS